MLSWILLDHPHQLCKLESSLWCTLVLFDANLGAQGGRSLLQGHQGEPDSPLETRSGKRSPEKGPAGLRPSPHCGERAWRPSAVLPGLFSRAASTRVHQTCSQRLLARGPCGPSLPAWPSVLPSADSWDDCTFLFVFMLTTYWWVLPPRRPL